MVERAEERVSKMMRELVNCHANQTTIVRKSVHETHEILNTNDDGERENTKKLREVKLLR